ncbi:unnamed protein product [[Candida] boidinii]|uniref:Trafficking protein particle complex subunit n=1 Tax=Candida boidinii TaxID=5477 RepID=A0A9W6SYZ4_CANBO|nr:unnamed protein product [[Candida] boidinii]GMF98172.1 unnamed protein product [[Candida] boidinii]GMF99395.1 unnamed protein product [[Candida] boidinii]
MQDSEFSIRNMAIYSYWVFDRHCNCVYSREWSRPVAQTNNNQLDPNKQSRIPGAINQKNLDPKASLLFGALFSMRKIAISLVKPTESESGIFSGETIGRINFLRSYSTNKYKCHFYETLSGFKFAFLSDTNTEDLHIFLEEIYMKIFMNCVIRNPLSQADFKAGEVIKNESFINKLDAYMVTIPAF